MARTKGRHARVEPRRFTHQIKTRLHKREAAAVTNFPGALERADSELADSELAQQITKDPYALDFLAIDSDASERALEDRLVERIIETLRELGPGFSFVGRQVQLTVGESDFFVDLLPASHWREMQKPSKQWFDLALPGEELIGTTAVLQPGIAENGTEYMCYSLVIQESTRRSSTCTIECPRSSQRLPRKPVFGTPCCIRSLATPLSHGVTDGGARGRTLFMTCVVYGALG